MNVQPSVICSFVRTWEQNVGLPKWMRDQHQLCNFSRRTALDQQRHPMHMRASFRTQQNTKCWFFKFDSFSPPACLSFLKHGNVYLVCDALGFSKKNYKENSRILGNFHIKQRIPMNSPWDCERDTSSSLAKILKNSHWISTKRMKAVDHLLEELPQKSRPHMTLTRRVAKMMQK